MFGKLLDSTLNVATSVVDTALQPVSDTLDILDGLSEGEIRTRAIVRLGMNEADVAGMAIEEVINLLVEN